MSRHCLVWFVVDKTSFVVPISDIKGDSGIGQVVDVKWPGDPQTYPAKVIFTGSKTDCEKKLKYVKNDGTLAGRQFDVAPSAPRNTSSPPLVSATTAPQPISSTAQPTLSDIFNALTTLNSKVDECLANQNEIVRRLRLVENACSSRASNEKSVSSQLNEITFSTTNACDQLRHVIKKLPAKVVQGHIDYIYASKIEVEGLRQLRPDYKKFLLDLERIVYKDEEDQLSVLVEKRVTTSDRVEFIKQCLVHYYAVPIESRETVWRDARVALNARARRLSKIKHTGTPTSSRSANTSTYNPDDSFADDFDATNIANVSFSHHSRTPIRTHFTPTSSSPMHDPYTFE